MSYQVSLRSLYFTFVSLCLGDPVLKGRVVSNEPERRALHLPRTFCPSKCTMHMVCLVPPSRTAQDYLIIDGSEINTMANLPMRLFAISTGRDTYDFSSIAHYTINGVYPIGTKVAVLMLESVRS